MISEDQWSTTRSAELYNIDGWSDGYFRIGEDGHATMQPANISAHPGIDLYRLAQEIKAAGLELPVLVRFPNILHHRIDWLCDAFDLACKQQDFRGRYTAVYPIKVNQQRSVISHILAHGGTRVGLEAGSKPELLAVLGSAPPGSVIVCNGYKDAEYVRLGLIGKRLGHRLYLVMEKPSELDTILEQTQALGIEPLLGLRVRLASLGSGKWQNSGGEHGKFGFTAAQVVTAIERLRSADHLRNLRLLHFHMGSQIPSVRDIRRGVQEAARWYAALYRQGAPIDVFDVGGGLGVDYEGSRSRHYFSVNYSINEYAHTIVHQLAEICQELDLPHPDLISEAGRAMTAHHAVLITQVVDCEYNTDPKPVTVPEDAEPSIVHELWRLYHNSSGLSLSERYYEVAHWLAEAQIMFSHGLLDLTLRARIEALAVATWHDIATQLQDSNRFYGEMADELRERLADKYFCNLSVFQSIPDVWGLDQVFPIMPLHRLDEMPRQHATLNDLTCDSDGQIRSYINGPTTDSTIRLHCVTRTEPYLLGIFLIGAYQEILGDMHNLFGDTNSVNVEVEDDNYRLVAAEHGDTALEVLQYVHFEPKALMAEYRRKVERAGLSPAAARSVLSELQAGLSGYTYLDAC